MFRYQANGLISFVSNLGSPGISVAQNINGYGFELELNWNVNETCTIIANYAWQHSKVAHTNQDSANAPQQLAHTELRWKFLNKWSLGTQLSFVCDRARENGDPREQLDNYVLADLTVFSNGLTKNWDLSLTFHNLFDKQAFEPGEFTVPIDHPLPGRSFLFSIDFTAR